MPRQNPRPPLRPVPRRPWRGAIIPWLVSLGLGLGSGAAWAHGVQITYTPDANNPHQINLQALFDTGEPLAQGSVTVYAPANPAEPWLQTTTDQEGNFQFVPDGQQPGQWDVKVRQAGHGGLVHLELVAARGGLVLAEGDTLSTQTPNRGQQWLGAALVLGGLLGLGLWVDRQKSPSLESSGE